MTNARTKRPREPELPATDGLTVLHRSRLVPWNVAAVTAIAACPDGSVFATGYDDGKVEVIDATHFNCLARISGRPGSEISGLAWARAPGDPHWRLFGSTLEGTLLELSCQQLQPVASTDSYGGAFWCLKAAPCTNTGSNSSSSRVGYTTQLAAACGDGSIKLYSIHANIAGAEYVRSLPRVEGNVLALAWHPAGHSLVSGGSDGCIHCWNVKQGIELQRLTAGTSSTIPPCVWALAVLQDGTVVSGDQEGAVQFWDGRLGTLLSRQQQFAADVLCLAAAPDGRTVWASGVDPRVAIFGAVPDKSTGVSRWLFIDRKQPHTHDVRCLAVLQRPDSDPLLLSGSNDGQIMLYSVPRFLKEHPIRQSKAPQAPLLQLSTACRPVVLLQAYQQELRLWQLGRAVAKQLPQAGCQHLEGDPWDLAALPSQLAVISISSNQHIAAAALAPDASAIAAADSSKLRLFRVTAAAEDASSDSHPTATAVQIQKVKVQQDLGAPAVCCKFSSDSKHLLAATGFGSIVAVDSSTGEVTASVQLWQQSSSSSNTSKAGAAAVGQQKQQKQQQQWCAALTPYAPAVSHIAVAPNGQLIAVATAGGVKLLSVPQLQHREQLMLVGDAAPITAIAFSCNSKFIAVATAANAVTAYSADTGMPTQWTLDNHTALAEMLQQLPGSVTGLAFNPAPAQALSLLVHSAGGLCHLNMSVPLTPPKALKQPRKCLNPALPQVDSLTEVGRNGRLLKLQHCCLLLDYISQHEALLLEKPWQDVLQQLQPPLYRHRYGT